MSRRSPMSSRRWMSPARVAAVCGAAVVLLLPAACSGSSEPVSGGGDQPAELTITQVLEPANWDWTTTGGAGIPQVVALNVVEPLVELLEDGSFRPLVAEEYQVSEDGLVYTFTIREAVFHDGSELTADDVVYSLELNRQAGQVTVSQPFALVQAIEKVDDRTVQVTLSQPSQSFLAGMSGLSGAVIPDGSAGQLPDAPVGTGPFAFSAWRHGSDVQLQRFADYWGEQPFFEDVTVRFIADDIASINALRAGDIDIVQGIGGAFDQIDVLNSTDGFTTIPQNASTIMWFNLNAQNEAFADERVRQAIAHAIDREAIIAGATPGSADPTCVFVNPPGVAWSSDACPYPHDPQRARDLLAEAGVSDLAIELEFPTVGFFPTMADIIVSQLEEVGITVTRQSQEFAVFLSEIFVPDGEDPDYQSMVLAGEPPIDRFRCPGDFVRDCVPEMDELLAQADAALDPETWAKLRIQAVELHAERAYVIPIANLSATSALRDDLAGVKPFRSANEFDLRGLHWQG